MYGLKQAAILAYENLVRNLSQYGYRPVPYALGIWKHEKRPINFCLCVDDFGIKYSSVNDAKHLLQSLEKHYTVTTDWSGKKFCGLTIDWHYDKGFVDIAMPKYVNNVLKNSITVLKNSHSIRHIITTQSFMEKRTTTICAISSHNTSSTKRKDKVRSVCSRITTLLC